jgi:hypothetical protein
MLIDPPYRRAVPVPDGVGGDGPGPTTVGA